MRLNDPAPRPVIHWCLENRIDVLNQGSVTPDVEGLRALAYSENRLVKIEGVLQQQLIHPPCGPDQSAHIAEFFLPSISVDQTSNPLPRKQHALNPLEQPGHAILALVQRNRDKGVAPAQCSADKYCGRARWLYSVLAGGGFRESRMPNGHRNPVYASSAFPRQCLLKGEPTGFFVASLPEFGDYANADVTFRTASETIRRLIPLNRMLMPKTSPDHPRRVQRPMFQDH